MEAFRELDHVCTDFYSIFVFESLAVDSKVRFAASALLNLLDPVVLCHKILLYSTHWCVVGNG